MPYSYNSQGQIVYTEDGAPQQGGAALPTKDITGTLIPMDPSDPRYADARKMDDNGLWTMLNGDPGTGKKYDSTGRIVNTTLGQKFTTGLENVIRYGLEGTAMAAGGALAGEGLAAVAGGAGAGGGAGVEALPFAGQEAVQTAAPSLWQSIAAKGLEGAVQGGIQNHSWKGALIGGAEGALGGAAGGVKIPGGGVINNLVETGAQSGGGGGMNWIDALKDAYKGYQAYEGIKGGGGGGSDVPGDGMDPGMSFPDGGTSSGGGSKTPVWQQVLDAVSGKGTAGKVVGTAGDVATGIEEGRSKDRASQNTFNLSQDRNRLEANTAYENALENRAALELKQALSKQSYQGDAYKQALLGALGKNMQDVTLGGVPKDVPVIQFNGGARPSAIGPEGRAAAALMNTKAMADLQNGLQTSTLPDIEKFTPSDYKQGNAVDAILGGVGTVGKIGDIWNQRGQNQSANDYIKQIQDELKKQKGVAVPTGGDQPPPKYVMIDPQTGKPVMIDQQDDTFGNSTSQQAPEPQPYFGG